MSHFFLLCLSLSAVSLANAQLSVTIATDASIFVTEPTFISFNLDSFVFDPLNRQIWDNFDRSSPKLHNLMRGLSPALLRVGGSPADWLFFDVPYSVLNATKLSPQPIILTKTDWDDMVQLTLATDNRLLFDLNLQQRFGLQWDTSQAIRLFEYCRQKGYGKNLDWELGNEPDYYTHPGQVTVPTEQISADFSNLRRLLDAYPSLRAGSLVGPDVVSFPNDIVHDFVNIAGGDVTALTTHHYYFRGDTATWKDYINPVYFSGAFEKQLRQTKTIITQSKHPELKHWIGETSDSWHSGTAGVSDRFISGFLWLDKLGIAAKMGVGVVMRQTFYGHQYSLISLDLNPNPDYWLSLLHKKLVGPKVLYAETSHSNSSTVKVYAHCSAAGAAYPTGAVTLFALNINNHTEHLTLSEQFVKLPYEVYLMTPGDGEQNGLLSKEVKLNGNVLSLMPDSSLPDLLPVTRSAGMTLDLPAYSYAFWVFPDAEAPACS
ncbi:hypothetical protein CAPTEDRAFT_185929 [Capitella teleta]|uniref:Heparanase n=1 Tax=Capitella teleta TaxID=283909 RepID=R7T5U4_CAPTE|nr:hypothetical protein CAPTEDRAFT_185929 [Capitella teleta]|eukprot:ELT88779.1 hypothetical protein CAPTEDRAFT_185929 [Capitella teleta]